MTITAKHIIIVGSIVGLVLLLTNKRVQKAVSAGASAVTDYVFSKEQNLYLDELLPEARAIFQRFIKEVQEKTGYRILITSGHRDYDEQVTQNNKNGKNASPGNSTHNWRIALDLNAIKGTHHLKKASPNKEWQDSGIVKIAKDLGMVWGGDFEGNRDPVHFDLRNRFPVADLKKKGLAQQGGDLKKAINSYTKLT